MRAVNCLELRKEYPLSLFFFLSAIRYHGSSSSIKCHVYRHVGGEAVLSRKREMSIRDENREIIRREIENREMIREINLRNPFPFI